MVCVSIKGEIHTTTDAHRRGGQEAVVEPRFYILLKLNSYQSELLCISQLFQLWDKILDTRNLREKKLIWAHSCRSFSSGLADSKVGT